MKIRLTVTFDDEAREIIAEYYGETGKATREMCLTFINGAITGALEAV